MHLTVIRISTENEYTILWALTVFVFQQNQFREMHEILPINISFCVAPLQRRIQVFCCCGARARGLFKLRSRILCNSFWFYRARFFCRFLFLLPANLLKVSDVRQHFSAHEVDRVLFWRIEMCLMLQHGKRWFDVKAQ